MQTTIQQKLEEIEILKIEISQKTDEVNKKNPITPRYKDPKHLIKTSYGEKDDRCPKRCQRWDGGNKSCRIDCGWGEINGFNDANKADYAKRAVVYAKEVKPLEDKKKKIEREIQKQKEIASMPYLRTDLMATSQELQQLQKDDPLFRQKKTDLSKELFKQAQELDTLENKYNLFGNIPSLKPEIITPDPVVRTKTELGAINTTPLIIGGIVGLAALFLIWRFK